MDRPFIKGLELSELFYEGAVKPILAERFPDLIYSAALLGPGSEVLGFDTPQSMDHDWGPRLLLFLGEADHNSYQQEVDETLRRELSGEIRGYPTGFGHHEDGTRVMVKSGSGPVHHRVELHTVRRYFLDLLSWDPLGPISAVDWVGVPAHRLLMVTTGRVYHDGLDQLGPIRAELRYYPHDVWLYLLEAQWRRIAQEEAFLGRCGQVGDDLGSRLIAARLVRDLMNLCFLIERRYAPYIKWFGLAFARLDCAAELGPVLARVLEVDSWEARQTHLTAAYQAVARMHNRLGVTEPLAPNVSPFHNRPFLVLHADRFVDALRGAIESQEVMAFPEHLGAVDQFIDSTDAWNHLRQLRALYGEGAA